MKLYIKYTKTIKISALFILYFISLNCSNLNNEYVNYQSGISAGGCTYSSCHPLTPLAVSEPTSGIHTTHLARANPISGAANIICEDCHYEYLNYELHRNAVINGYNSLTNEEAEGDIIIFNEDNPDASWSNEGSVCMNVACHNVGGTTGKYPFMSSANGVTEDLSTGTSEPSCLLCHSFAIESSKITVKDALGNEIFDTVTGLAIPVVRRAITPEYDNVPTIGNGHHNGTQIDNKACRVCHLIDSIQWDPVNFPAQTHRSGTIYLYDMDNSTNATGTHSSVGSQSFYTLETENYLTGFNQTAGSEANLSNFCMGCHDALGLTMPLANNLAINSQIDPFGNGRTGIIPDAKTNSFDSAITIEWQDDASGFNYYGGATRHVNNRHNVLASDSIYAATPGFTKMDCLDCHGAHNSAKNQPVANPWARWKPYDYSDTNPVLDKEKKNKFCLECHSGGEGPIAPGAGETNAYKMQFPPRIMPERSLSAFDNTIYRVDFINWSGYTKPDGVPKPWMNTGEYAFNGVTWSGVITSWNDADTQWDGVSAFTGSMNIKLLSGTMASGNPFEFRYCSWWDTNCDITDILESDYEKNGTAQLSSVTVEKAGVTGEASFIKGISSGGYSQSPWSVGFSWRFSPHGKDSKRSWSNPAELNRYSEAYFLTNGDKYISELSCQDCHDKHGSANLYSIKSNITAPATTGEEYYDDGHYENLNTTPVKVDSLAAPYNGAVNIVSYGDVAPVVNKPLDLTPLCKKCHEFTPEILPQHGGHSADFTVTGCVSCHNHGGSADRDGWLFKGVEDTPLSECGNGDPNDGNAVLGLYEECDDGNTVNGDGCSSACEIETPKPTTVALYQIPAGIAYDANTGVLLGLEEAAEEDEEGIAPVGCFIGGDTSTSSASSAWLYLLMPTFLAILIARIQRRFRNK
ncbi:MAG: hypothetical protein OEZ13_01150 [Spirochaetia bacterium]|nr:hypothetical protein [Spirochaetia bacterium]